METTFRNILNIVCDDGYAKAIHIVDLFCSPGDIKFQYDVDNEMLSIIEERTILLGQNNSNRYDWLNSKMKKMN